MKRGQVVILKDSRLVCSCITSVEAWNTHRACLVIALQRQAVGSFFSDRRQAVAAQALSAESTIYFTGISYAYRNNFTSTIRT
jgi:hypothetical protein